MYKQNVDHVKKVVGETLGVCGLLRCQVCKNGTLYYEAYRDGTMRGRCSDAECAEYTEVPLEEWSHAKDGKVP